jgi:hypothetical protein
MRYFSFRCWLGHHNFIEMGGSSNGDTAWGCKRCGKDGGWTHTTPELTFIVKHPKDSK